MFGPTLSSVCRTCFLNPPGFTQFPAYALLGTALARCSSYTAVELNGTALYTVQNHSKRGYHDHTAALSQPQSATGTRAAGLADAGLGLAVSGVPQQSDGCTACSDRAHPSLMEPESSNDFCAR